MAGGGVVLNRASMANIQARRGSSQTFRTACQAVARSSSARTRVTAPCSTCRAACWTSQHHPSPLPTAAASCPALPCPACSSPTPAPLAGLPAPQDYQGRLTFYVILVAAVAAAGGLLFGEAGDACPGDGLSRSRMVCASVTAPPPAPPHNPPTPSPLPPPLFPHTHPAHAPPCCAAQATTSV